MSAEHVEAVARSLLYEGYALYPYRASALKNQRRFPFGALAPRAFAEAVGGAERWRLIAEVLIEGSDEATIALELRFLRPADRALTAREVRDALELPALYVLRKEPVEQASSLPAVDDEGGHYGALSYSVRVTAMRLERELHRVCVEVRNAERVVLDDAALRGRPDPTTRERMARCSLTSTHVVFALRDPTVYQANFVSLIDPPEPYAVHAAECANDGVFPVLVGLDGARDTMLASPVVLYDYPRIAPESPGDFFDGTEIDAMLALRVQTLTDREKDEIRAESGDAAAILERADALKDGPMRALYGRLEAEVTDRAGCPLAIGDAVRIHPSARADVMDIALAGRRATVRSIEHAVSGDRLVTVTVDDDPGQDLGLRGWPGHRFFFHPNELERLG